MPGKFVIALSKNGQFMFSLKAVNGQKILSSELYTSKSGCENGIASVKSNASLDARYEKKVSTSGKPFFVLKAGNHEIIGTSELYESEASRDAGIDSVKTHAPDAEVEDTTKS